MIEFLGGRCELCGYCRNIRALTFHHVDRETKAFTFAGSHNRSWRALKTELAKCVLLCKNCHAEVEDGMIQLPAPLVQAVRAAVAELGITPRPVRRAGRPTIEPA